MGVVRKLLLGASEDQGPPKGPKNGGWRLRAGPPTHCSQCIMDRIGVRTYSSTFIDLMFLTVVRPTVQTMQRWLLDCPALTQARTGIFVRFLSAWYQRAVLSFERRFNLLDYVSICTSGGGRWAGGHHAGSTMLSVLRTALVRHRHRQLKRDAVFSSKCTRNHSAAGSAWTRWGSLDVTLRTP